MNGGWKNWVIGILAAISAWSLGAMGNKLESLDRAQQSRGERIMRLETEMLEVRTWLTRVEKKLDAALEERHTQPRR